MRTSLLSHQPNPHELGDVQLLQEGASRIKLLAGLHWNQTQYINNFNKTYSIVLNEHKANVWEIPSIMDNKCESIAFALVLPFLDSSIRRDQFHYQIKSIPHCSFHGCLSVCILYIYIYASAVLKTSHVNLQHDDEMAAGHQVDARRLSLHYGNLRQYSARKFAAPSTPKHICVYARAVKRTSEQTSLHFIHWLRAKWSESQVLRDGFCKWK